MPDLYPFQARNVEAILADECKRWITDETGLGKSVTAIAATRRINAKRILVVTKGMVRPGWMDRFREWMPDRVDDLAAITMGKARKGLSKPAAARLEVAYAKPIQVVSYDLLKEVDKDGWDAIILDEIHEIVGYRSATSKALRELFTANPSALKLGITATLLSAEPLNAWNLLSLFWPARWGKARQSGDPPFWFCNLFAEVYENDHGKAWRGIRQENAHVFRKSIDAVSLRTLRSEVADLLPPIDCSPLVIELKNKKSDLQLAMEWCDTASRETSHISLFTYFRESAQRLADELRSLPRYRDVEIAMVHGASTPEQRHKILNRLRDASRGILVGTMDSLGTGITLTAFHQYLLSEVTTTANKLVQAIGRFSRLDSKVPSRGFILLREGKDDDKIATLKRRLGDFDTLMRAGQGEVSLLSLLSAQMKGDGFDRRLDDLIANFLGNLEEDDEDVSDS